MALDKLKGVYHSWMQKFFYGLSFVSQDEVVKAFWGIPNCTFSSRANTIIEGDEPLVYLRRYIIPYQKIRKAAEKGDSSITFSYSDFKGVMGIASFMEIQRLQEEARQNGAECIISKLELRLE